MNDKQPLLGVKTGTSDGTPDDAPLVIVRARRRPPRHAFVLAGLILFVTGLVWFHRGVHWGGNEKITSTPLDGPLVFPGPICHAHHHGASPIRHDFSFPLTFGPDRSLYIEEDTTHRPDHADSADEVAEVADLQYVQVTGEVVVRRALSSAGRVDVEALSNDDRIVVAVSFTEKQALSVRVADRIATEDRERPCIVVRITVWVPAEDDSDDDAELETLLVHNVHLGIQLIDDLRLTVGAYARLRSIAGRIHAARPLEEDEEDCHFHEDPFHEEDLHRPASRYRFAGTKTYVHTVSGSVRGFWSLLDQLGIFSVSGSVRALVQPQDAETEVAPGLRIGTESGAQALYELPPANASGHRHRLHLYSKSGSIWANASFAEEAVVESTSGSLHLDLRAAAPVDPAQPTATLRTHTISGSTHLRLAADDDDEGAVDWLTSLHEAVSGSIHLLYTDAWVGAIHLASRVSGSVQLRGGTDVHERPDDRPKWPRLGHRLEATKGQGGSDLRAETTTGSIHLTFE